MKKYLLIVLTGLVFSFLEFLVDVLKQLFNFPGDVFWHLLLIFLMWGIFDEITKKSKDKKNIDEPEN